MKYAHIDENDNCRIVDWIDTALMNYNLPPEKFLVTGIDWPVDRETQPYMLSDGRFVPYVAQTKLETSPSTCSPAQGLVALFALREITEEDVLSAIGQIADPVEQYTARISYQRATTWERGSPTMQVMAGLLKLSEHDLDELFSYAIGVVV
ncbi:hypothetical protein [Comamonas terrigena]|uniref:hypothetical protein n=1 Tax=Comamonas terrigena TaxID=32013 RepID=UPI00244B37AD|nr:hypothetical protein [Comamonas terrigena]MDH0050288.1 hypothetical protein [Comamonas terrigena]MDH0512661.1 hypothetical protein [Comamonas terrigena]MDH1092896.1 hypothetical protein [Comamonas terrigena]MDH1502714.1 hypothetical protein [Comamonas terrigena]